MTIIATPEQLIAPHRHHGRRLPVNICAYCGGQYEASTCPCPAAKRVSQSRRAELDHAHQQERWLAVTKTDWPFGLKAVVKKKEVGL